MAARPATHEPDRSRPPLDVPELELMARLAEEVEAFGPLTRGQVARALERCIDAAGAQGLDAAGRRRAVEWMKDRAEAAERQARKAADDAAPTIAEPEPTPAVDADPPEPIEPAAE